MKTVTVDGKCVIPSKVVCVGRNYVEHIKELKNEIPTSMVIFMKPNTAISAELITGKQTPLHYEGEISFLIKQRKISAVGFGLDLTHRELQSELKAKGLPWERAKAFNGAAVMSSFVSIKEEDIDKLSLQLWINGVLVQEGGVELMIYKPLAIIKEINTFSTLEDHDIVMSGTPKGVGSYVKGDIFVGKIFVDKKELLSQEWIAQ
ncbi:fumarylacetoacetate hydrolase family protein [Sulfurospirillum barnesii]|uniref:2-keto-4-pentenoate hydratase/2-oxohepta-3-ene-1,7-dioic acid hydratase n=1 Tax=Sulfurospirillum barnesii (strain ATCC 700032 / DSM 10660 / SES-3) TaxID=760154 RepID=I3XTY0_SULBS|nr:fumarylacetoacetate hydrolase family protein [Sulfurospirillum barnesii]AFL67404.1 2-keto-4-pentenoate hydratase/2-oxohepta-3-ene-1,7-dioic acid hydratase [Sulfurospirillum barnesii SES-3]